MMYGSIKGFEDKFRCDTHGLDFNDVRALRHHLHHLHHHHHHQQHVSIKDGPSTSRRKRRSPLQSAATGSSVHKSRKKGPTLRVAKTRAVGPEMDRQISMENSGTANDINMNEVGADSMYEDGVPSTNMEENTVTDSQRALSQTESMDSVEVGTDVSGGTEGVRGDDGGGERKKRRREEETGGQGRGGEEGGREGRGGRGGRNGTARTEGLGGGGRGAGGADAGAEGNTEASTPLSLHQFAELLGKGPLKHGEAFPAYSLIVHSLHSLCSHTHSFSY
eukprot:GHVU01128938.1.p1 GENE.GHVU01128938.1~~GHVU01128938.1.p1  ORF type:complete len:293 (+),score=51.08 GHVU01128938.1:51-881(+)